MCLRSKRVSVTRSLVHPWATEQVHASNNLHYVWEKKIQIEIELQREREREREKMESKSWELVNARGKRKKNAQTEMRVY